MPRLSFTRKPGFRVGLAVFPALLAVATASAQSYNISTFAGGALPVNVAGTSASLYGPQSAFAIDPTGNVFFVDGNAVLRLDAVSGIVTLVAGNGTAGYSGDNGPAASAQLHNPNGLALDSLGNLYIASFYDNVVRMVQGTSPGSIITTVVGTGTAGFSGDNNWATGAQLNNPCGIAVDSSNNLYIADYGNNRIREVSGGFITTVAGTGVAGFGGDNGAATSAQLSAPRGIAVDSTGNLYIADSGNNRIRELSGGVIGTIAGNGAAGFSGDSGPAVAAELNVPTGVALDSSGNLYIADYYNDRIRKVTGGAITTAAGKGIQGFSGDGGTAATAQLNDPLAVALDFAGNLYIADYGNNRVREVSAGVINTVAGNGTAGFGGDGGSAIGAELHLPDAVALDSTGNLYFADSRNNRIRKVAAGLISTMAGNGIAGFSGDSGSALNAQLNQPAGIALDSSGSLYIADTVNNLVRKVTAGGVITTVAGSGTPGFSGDNGPAASAQLNQPGGVGLDSSGNLYIADTGNNRVRKVSGTTIATFAGTGVAGSSGDSGAALSAQLNAPAALAFDTAGNLYIADTGNNRIRKISGGTITTVAGTGSPGYSGDNAAATSATLNAPAAVALDATGNLYIADSGNNAIRKISSAAGGGISGNGMIATIAGGGTTFGDNGPATSADLATPQGLAVDSTGNVYIADTFDNRVRLLTRIALGITSPSSLAAGLIGIAYPSVTFAATGGSGAYTWSATGLPKGMTFSAAGVFSGTPTSAATVSIPFTVRDASGASATTTLSLSLAAPLPVISTLSPTTATAYGAAFTLTVNGTGFLAGAAIQWNGTSLTTRVVSSTQLTASVTAALIATAGTASVSVVSSGSTSNTIQFSINPPTPGLTSISPTSATASGTDFTLTATGKGFVQSSQIEWNNSPLITTFVSATQLTADVPAANIASAGTASVTISSGQTPSPTQTFTINAPPAITAFSPPSTLAYGSAFTLTVSGTGFSSGATVQWGSTGLATKFISATQLTASVPASAIGGAGSVQVTVTSGGVQTAAMAFTINPPPPVISNLNPASAIATGAAFTLAVNGSGFTQSDTVQWNGSALPTTYVSASQLTAYVTASLIATTGSISVTINAGSVTTAATAFPVTAPPAITTLTPASVIAGVAGFTLNVKGTGFAQTTQVQWNGATLPTTFVSATQLTAAVPASLTLNAGTVTIQVTFSGNTSPGITFTINGPPTVASLSPAAAAVGGSAFTLTVTGTGFLSGAAVNWNGTALTTKFVSATQLTASIATALIASAAVATVTVTSGGVLSNGSPFPINPPPTITDLSPATVPGTGSALTLTVDGTGFASGATVQWNGTALPTTFVAATQLTAAVPVNLAAGSGSASITVDDPGGIASTAVKLPITAVPPVVIPGGVVPIYSSVPTIQSGSWVSIYGTGLASGTAVWTGNFPTSLGGTSVTIDNKQAFLWSVSPTQINLQAPTDTATGPVSVVVTTASGTTTSTVNLAAYGPSFSLLPGSSYAAGVILTSGGTGAYGGGTYDLVGPSGYFSFNTRPVNPGETLELFGVGFGPTKPAVPAGKTYKGAAPTTNTISVTIGGVAAKVLFSGITEAGVYQFNVTVPNVGAGDQPLVATVAGVSTPLGVLMTVQ